MKYTLKIYELHFSSFVYLLINFDNHLLQSEFSIEFYNVIL